ncbi:MAG: hypothetical protein KGJ07_06845 [Patescibacteria group bacterium]|nr:hypothetical protein [Patescibacteria group bacterium]
MWNSTDDKKKKKKQLKTSYTNPFEAFEDIGKGITDQVTTHAKAGAGEAVKQIFGGEFNLMSKGAPKSGDLQPGQEIDLKAQAQAQKAQQEQQKAMQKKAESIRPAIDYVGEILHSNEKQTQQETQKLRDEIQNLIMEVKSLAGASASLEKQVIESTSGNVVSPGKYHKTFFSWIISIVRDARQKVDNANVWISATKGKQKGASGAKPKKGMNYWDMAKQHGVTNFTLSGERSTATQTG